MGHTVYLISSRLKLLTLESPPCMIRTFLETRVATGSKLKISKLNNSRHYPAKQSENLVSQKKIFVKYYIK